MEEVSSYGVSGEPLACFSSNEIMELESVFKDLVKDSLQKEFCMEIANRFSCTRSCGGEPVIKWEQVQNWFQDKQMKVKVKPHRYSSPEKMPEKFAVMYLEAKLDSSPPSKKTLRPNAGAAARSSKRWKIVTPNGKTALDLKEMMYEAQSTKEYAWYDVALFRNFRYNCRTGELEVFVRFKGYNREEDEWINVKRQVRQRSIPLVPSECHTVKVGDLVMCHLVSNTAALYYDARVINIERDSHDTSGCNCVFEVRYVHDSFKEKVPLNKLCSRPR